MAAIFSSLSTAGYKVCVWTIGIQLHTFSSLPLAVQINTRTAGLNTRLSDAKFCEQIAVKLFIFLTSAIKHAVKWIVFKHDWESKFLYTPVVCQKL